MKKSMILAIVGMAMSMSVHAQVQFSKFKFYVADIMDFSHLQLETKFKVTSDRNLKYVHVFFTPVNGVGDALVDEYPQGLDSSARWRLCHGREVGAEAHVAALRAVHCECLRGRVVSHDHFLAL